MRRILFLFISQVSFLLVLAQSYDAVAIEKLKKEEDQKSQVMDIAFQLTDVNGPRLTASPGYMKAANWAKDKLISWGLSNARVEPWGEFGKGWELEKSYLAMTKPYYAPLIAFPRAWTSGTGKSPLRSEIILIKATDSAGLMEYAGKLKGRIVMTWMSDTLKPSFSADASRYADTVLDRMSKAEPATTPNRGQQNAGRNPMAARLSFQRTLSNLLNSEKPALVLTMNGRGTDGTLFVSSGGAYTKDAVQAPASVVLSSDDYLRIQRLVSAGIPVEIEAEIRTRFYDKDLKGYNVIAEIPGSDPVLKNEIVMLGGHLDSWHASTGATDNAAGCAVMMEAVRLIQSMNLKPKRTIRIALWSGEEQGLFGSRNYVKTNLADPATMLLQPEHGKISAYYNLDNGTGRIRGIYLQGNAALRTLFTEWLEPFKDMGASTVTINNTGGTDHLSFDAVGIPGFQFIQDPVEYNTRTHHTNMDTYDHLVPEDLKQASAIVAAFVYNTAQQPQLLPRKALPEARTTRGF